MWRRAGATLWLAWLGACGGDAGDAVTPEPTSWFADIAPLIGRHCLPCHADGGIGPLRLDTLQDVRAAAPLVLGVIASGQMPPWMPADDCHPLAAVRQVDAAEEGVLRAWVADGMPAGDPADAPAAPGDGHDVPFAATERWAVSKGYVPTAPTGGDDYHCFVLDREFDSETWVTGTRVEPDDGAGVGSGQVHHVLVYAIEPAQLAEMQARDDAHPGRGYPCFAQPVSTGFAGQDAFIEYLAGGELPNFDFPILLGAWVPGVAARVLPAGTAYRVPRGSKLVVQIHFSPRGAAVPDDTHLSLITTTTLPTSLLRTRPVAILDLDIPAGDPAVVASRAFPYHGAKPLEIVGVMGHMHLLGTALVADVMRGADEASACLLDIPRWDFHWQESYRFLPDDPVMLAPGDALQLTCSYDNSAEHQVPGPDGSKPAPRHVTWGEGTRDEMCLFYYTTAHPFTPTDVAPATACAPAADCIARCADNGRPAASLDCLLACNDASVACQLCGVRAALQCSQFECLGTLSNASDCLVTCLEASLMLGTNLGRCLQAECTGAYADALRCLDPQLPEAACRERFEPCGIAFPDIAP